MFGQRPKKGGDRIRTQMCRNGRVGLVNAANYILSWSWTTAVTATTTLRLAFTRSWPHLTRFFWPHLSMYVSPRRSSHWLLPARPGDLRCTSSCVTRPCPRCAYRLLSTGRGAFPHRGTIYFIFFCSSGRGYFMFSLF